MDRFDSAGQAMAAARPLSPRHPGPRPAVDRLQPVRSGTQRVGAPAVAPYLANRTETWGQEQGDSLEAIGDGWAVYRRTPPVLDWLASSSSSGLKLFTPLSIMLCLLLLFFGGLGTYYFRTFTRCYRGADPHYDLLIVTKNDPAELAFFRKKTTPDIIDPARQQLDILVKLRKSSDKCTVVPEDNDQTCKEIGNRLIEIMDTAKLRQIPKQYAKNYEAEVLVGISEIYRSWLAYQDAIGADIPADKERFYKESLKYSKSADKKLTTARTRYL